jgi:two-component system, OmpR family, sensor histidine kinase KdpD
MNDTRPNPDELLARVKAEEARSHRGKLKIFFGAAPGVGKTYAMLEAARREKAAGVDVVVGYVEPHGRKETEALLEGLEVVPTSQIEYHGMTLREVNVDAIIKRRPELVLIDELAHTNAEGSRHTKRWQDVEDLRAAGINVYSTLNVQHIESLNDIVAQITGVTVRETIPDRIFESADDLELADVTAEELLERMAAGKVYVHAQAERALQNFFQKSNLVALRELSLRLAAQRLHMDVELARRERASTETWATAERLLVCVGPSPTTPRVIRTARRMAAALNAEWIAVTVEPTRGATTNPAVREAIADHLRLAERLGAQSATLMGDDVAGTVLDYASSRNVTKIVIGKTNDPRWKRLLFGTVVDHLLENSGEIDVYVIHGKPERLPRATATPPSSEPFAWQAYAMSMMVVLVCALIASFFFRLHLSEANLVMVFLAGVAWVAFRYGRGPAILASIAAVLTFDFFFVRPYLTFAVSDTQYVITFAVMLAIGLILGTLTARLKEQVAHARLRERRTLALYELSRQLSSLSGSEFLVIAAGRQIEAIFEVEAAIYLANPGKTPELRYGQQTSIPKDQINAIVAQWVAEHDQIAGPGTDTLPNATALFLPLTASQGTLGALGVRTTSMSRLLAPDERQTLEACTSQLALALERDRMAVAAHEAQVQAEAEHLRSSLLSGVSHDLRTPLAVIAGASTSLLENRDASDATRHELLSTIVDESRRLSRLLENLLEMSKLESGAAAPNMQWHVLEELVGAALARTRHDLAHHRVQVNLHSELPLVRVDGILLEQVFINLFENAARYCPAGSRIDVTSAVDGQWLVITVADNGPGLLPGSEEKVFEKFFRGDRLPDSRRGSGLGLSICRAVIRLHGGAIVAANRPAGGAQFTIRLPIREESPRVIIDSGNIAVKETPCPTAR